MPLPTLYGPDIWGAIQIPVLPGTDTPTPPPDNATGDITANDPCLWYIGSFLRAFLSSDENVAAQWDVPGVAPGCPPVRTVIVGNPTDDGYSYSDNDLTTLFLWREKLDTGYLGDAIGQSESTLKLAWMYPLGQSEHKRVRLPFINALVKGIFVGIERGRTPGWIIDGETEKYALGADVWMAGASVTDIDQVVPPTPNGFVYTCTTPGITGSSAPTFPVVVGASVTDGTAVWTNAGTWKPQGSSLYKYAAFAKLHVQTSKPVTFRLKNVKGQTVKTCPGVEVSCYLLEDLQFGTANRPALDPNAGLELTTTPSQTGAQWAPDTQYDQGVQVYPLSAPNNFFYVCSTPGVSGTTEPTWPTTVNATVTDGSCTWTCAGPVTASNDLIV